MISIPPKSLQNSLIFYITCIIVFTNGFSAIVTLSRENINYYQEALNKSLFIGKLLREPAMDLFLNGSSTRLDRILSENSQEGMLLGVTLYDRNWWRKWGAPQRIPPEGFPTNMNQEEITYRSGIPGETRKEIYISVSTGSQWLGTFGIGIPEFSNVNGGTAIYQVLLTTGTNILLGIALAIFIGQVILRPLTTLLEGIEAIKRGNYEQRVNVFGEGEMAQLGQTFNLMAASLQEKIREGLERNRMLDEKVQELWEIFELTKAMGFSLHLQQILERFLEKAETLSFSSFGQIFLNNQESGQLEVRVATPSFPELKRNEYDESLQRCLTQRETVEAKIKEHTLIFLPLLSGNLVQGVLFLGKHGQKSYSSGIRRFLETIAPLGGSLVENARLYQHVVEMKDYVGNVLNSVDSAVATIDRDGRFVTVNEAFNRMFGTAGKNPAGKPVREFLLELNDPSFADFFEKYAMGRISKIHSVLSLATNRQELTLRTPGQENRILQLRVNRLHGGRNVVGRVVVADDVTALKQIERKMVDTERWAVLGRLAASVAHEIRNPLVSIRSLVEVIGEDLKGENAEHIRVVIGEVKRLNKVVEQLLDLSRPERTELREICVNDLLEELIVLLKHEASRANITIKKLWLDEKVYGKIDPEKIKQAFLNIMLNGIQAMEQGGTLKLSLSVSNLQTFDDHPPERFINIDFEDEGMGIPEELFSRVFDPFFTTRPHGTGLGLPTTKKIIDLHGGWIEVSSKVGSGTRFRIVIPQNGSEGLMKT